MRRLLAMVLLAATIAGGTATTAEAHYVHPKQPLNRMPLRQQVVYWTWSAKHYRFVCLESRDARIRRTNCKAWHWATEEKVIAQAAYLESLLPAHHALWECVQRHEAKWDDHNAPYWGGLQAGEWWTKHYGSKFLNNIYARKGMPDNWTPLEQMWVAERAYKLEGYGNTAWLNGQWPNTTTECPGLY